MPPIGMTAVQCEQMKVRVLQQFDGELAKKKTYSRFVDSNSFRSVINHIDTFIFDADGKLTLLLSFL